MQDAPMSRTRCKQENRIMRFDEACQGWTTARLTQGEAALLLGPSVGAPRPTMPSSDFSTVFSIGRPTPSRLPPQAHDTGEISRGKTPILPRVDAGFTKCTPAGVCPVRADGGLRGHVPAGPGCITPHIRFVFVAPQVSPWATSAPRLATTHWPFG